MQTVWRCQAEIVFWLLVSFLRGSIAPMWRKLLGLLLLVLLLLGLTLWRQKTPASALSAPCAGSPVSLTYEGREALWCLASTTPAALVEAAGVVGPCRETLLSLSSLSAAERLTLRQVGATCELQRTSLPASQRFVLGMALDLNEASQEDLEALPGVGPSVARAIVEDRTQHGPFLSVEDLDRVKGIGPKTIERLREFITVGKATE